MDRNGGEKLSNIVDEIKARCNITDVVGRYVTLKRGGSQNFKGLCPFHNEKTPSFNVSEKNQFYHCFGCGESGDVISFIEKIENVDFLTAVARLSDMYGINMEEHGFQNEGHRKVVYDINREAARFFFQNLRSRDNPGVRYITGRGLDPETIVRFGIGYAEDSWNRLRNHMHRKGFTDQQLLEAGLLSTKNDRYYDKFRDRVMFPIINTRGKVIGFGGRYIGTREGQAKYMNSPESSVFSKKNNLFGLNLTRNHIKEQDSVIVVEGYMDMVSLYSAGIRNVAATLGTALTSNHCSILKRYTDHVILSYDADSAGREAALNGIERLREAGLNPRVLHVTDGKDPDEYIRKHGGEAFEHLLQTAEPYVRYRLSHAERRHPLNTDEEKLALIHEAAQIFRDVGPAETEIYLPEWLQRTGIPESAVRGEINRIVPNQTTTAPVPRRQRNAADAEASEKTKLQKEILWILLNHPEKRKEIQELERDILPMNHPAHERIFQTIMNIYREGVELDSNQLMDSLDEGDAAEALQILHSIPKDADADRMLVQLRNNIRMRELEQERDFLQNKLHLSSDGSEDINDLMRQIEEINKWITELKKEIREGITGGPNGLSEPA